MKYYGVVLFIYVSGCLAVDFENKTSNQAPAGLYAITLTNNNNHRIITTNTVSTSSTQISSPPACVQPSSVQQVNPAQTLLDHLITSCWQYKAALVGVGCAATGCYLLAKLVVMQRSINSPNNWASWKGDIPLAELAKHSQVHLARALFNEITSRYSNKNILDPLVHFMNDLTQELQQLESASTLYSWFSKSYVGYVIPLLMHAHESVQEKIERLKFLKRLLIAWLSEYRVEHA